ncbi:HAMP domain-containing histidine kinase [Luteimonas gilva]|uniref:histidine kinase n=1 Tax=Luteimonas gilva TaxID=2572684 RepID=A0A4U5JJD2_9GAMM|nr:HAMP domain-containing sensor histidine kinase [Luteimonas gilva]TKR29660.1 HAMP domain-containing histidine kinase [Luteimonas gilva]
MSAAPARLLSTSARLALAVTVSFLLAFALLGAGVYYAVSTLLTADAREVVRADAAGLADIYRGAGRAPLIAELRDRLAAPDDPDAVYALVDRDGRAIVGSAPPLSVPRSAAPRWIVFRDRADGGTRVLARLSPLDDGETLLTGLRTRSQDGFLAMMLRTALIALLVAAALGALIGWLTARWVSRRLQSLDLTAARVGAGELALRARLDGSDDAFDRLAHRFNAMLDRIEELLGGVRHATDHIAHDLRTPLTRLRNRLDQLREREAPAPELDAAIAETDQLLQSFGALLRLARIEAQPPLHDAPAVDLQALVGDVLELYAPSAAERRIALRDATEPASVRGDADQLFQLLVNLVDNAVKFAPADSEVELTSSASGAEVRLQVRDHGPGIPVADRERVLDRFVRLETHRGSPGTGLGLSLVRAIVLRHEGRIELSDAAPGLRVCIALPRA